MDQVKRTWLLGLAAAAAAALTAAGPAQASPVPTLGDAAGCVQTAKGFGSIGAGRPTGKRAFSAHGTSDDYVCRTPDPTIHSAKEVWSESGTITCAPAEAVAWGTDTFTWSNGRKSVMRYYDHNVGNLDLDDAVFVSGEFAGTHATFDGTGASPFVDNLTTTASIVKACGLGKPITDVPSGYTGVLFFG